MREALLQEREVGVVTHYWGRPGVAGVHLTAPLDVGEHVHVLGRTSDFEQDVTSIEIEHHQVQHAEAGEDIGLRVTEHAHEHDRLYKSVTTNDIGSEGTEL